MRTDTFWPEMEIIYNVLSSVTCVFFELFGVVIPLDDQLTWC